MLRSRWPGGAGQQVRQRAQPRRRWDEGEGPDDQAGGDRGEVVGVEEGEVVGE